MNILLVGLGGALGSMARYLCTGFITKSVLGFPAGVVFINILGSFIIGLVTAELTKTHPAFLLLAIGFCGGFTTFSSFALEAWELLASGKFTAAVLYALISVVFSIVAFGLGLYLSRVTV